MDQTADIAYYVRGGKLQTGVLIQNGYVGVRFPVFENKKEL